jgi:hypothetical protein
MTAILLNDGEIGAVSPEKDGGLFKAAVALQIKCLAAKN